MELLPIAIGSWVTFMCGYVAWSKRKGKGKKFVKRCNVRKEIMTIKRYKTTLTDGNKKLF